MSIFFIKTYFLIVFNAFVMRKNEDKLFIKQRQKDNPTNRHRDLKASRHRDKHTHRPKHRHTDKEKRRWLKLECKK